MKKILALVLALALCIGCASAFAEGELVGVSMPTKDLQRWNQDGENLKALLEAAVYYSVRAGICQAKLVDEGYRLIHSISYI